MSSIPQVYLKPGREKALRRRHPWVFSGGIERVDSEPESGGTVRVVTHAGEFLAFGAYSARSQIRVRVWSFAADDVIDDAFIRRRVATAVAARRALGLLGANGACRLVYGESDGLPGLVVDRYGPYLACQFLSAGSERWRAVVLAGLVAEIGPRGIFERSESGARRKEGLASGHGLLHGEAPPATVEIETAGLRQLVDIAGGQKTGAYLDQRVNRARVGAYAGDRRVLDAYAFTGGFGLACLQGGAREAVLLDSSQAALQLAAQQARLNGVAQRCRMIEADVGDELRRLHGAGERFDLVVLDPPKFVQTAEQVASGSRAYKDINRLAFLLLRPDGVLATFSCSGHVDASLFQKIVASAAVEAGADAQILERLSQPPDHPVGVHFPEAEYLKGLLLRVHS